MVIPVFRPSVSQAEIDAVTRVLKSGWWGAGPEVSAFENEFAASIGVQHAVALNSCTAALHLAGELLKLPPGSEVIMSPITFVSTAFLASYNNLKIVFADVEEATLNIDPLDVERKITEKTKAILPVHYGGHACQMDELRVIADKHNLVVIEDCAHAAGGKYKGRSLGSLGDMACFSFQAVKNLAVGDGGMLVVNNEEWAERARVMRWVGINKDTAQRVGKDQYSWEYAITDVGYKYQMTDLMATIGREQLKRLSLLNGRRREITEKYNASFADVDWITTPVMKDYADSSNHNYCIKVPADKRDALAVYLKGKGISTSVHYKPLYMHKVYKNIEADCPVADRVWKEILLLPIYPDMTEEEQQKIIDSVRSFQF
jgi:perosamine synthetase